MPDLIDELKQGRFQIDTCLPQLSAIKEEKIDFHALTHGNYPGRRLPDELLRGISSMGFMDAVGEQDWGMENHRNEGIEICLQESGNNTLVVDGKKYPTTARSLSITRPWQLHRIGDPHLGPGRLHWIIIDVGAQRPSQTWQWPDWCILTHSDLAELTKLLRGNEQCIWSSNNELVQIFKQLALYVASPELVSQASRIIVTLNQLLIALLEMLRSQEIVTDDHLTSVTRSVELFLNDLQHNPEVLAIPWTLERMAEHCDMGRSTFSKYCYELQNNSPVEYLNRCRLNYAAKRLSSEPDTPVTEIAFDLSFSSSQYFSRAFKQQFGKTPTAWRAASSLLIQPRNTDSR